MPSCFAAHRCRDGGYVRVYDSPLAIWLSCSECRRWQIGFRSRINTTSIFVQKNATMTSRYARRHCRVRLLQPSHIFKINLYQVVAPKRKFTRQNPRFSIIGKCGSDESSGDEDLLGRSSAFSLSSTSDENLNDFTGLMIPRSSASSFKCRSRLLEETPKARPHLGIYI